PAVERPGEHGPAVRLDDDRADVATRQRLARHAPGRAHVRPLEDNHAIARPDQELARGGGRRIDVRAAVRQSDGHSAVLLARRPGPAVMRARPAYLQAPRPHLNCLAASLAPPPPAVNQARAPAAAWALTVARHTAAATV